MVSGKGPVPNQADTVAFWHSVWSEPVKHNERPWTEVVASQCAVITPIDPVIITPDDVAEAVRRAPNWKSPGLDGLHHYWLKGFMMEEEKKSPNVIKSATKTKNTFHSETKSKGLVYVQKHVRENELAKLMGLKKDFRNIQHFLSETDLDKENFPDRGVKLIEKLIALEQEMRHKSSKVKKMVVATDPGDPIEVVYVQKHVRENELAKLMGLQKDFRNIQHLLSETHLDTFPDRGVNLIKKLTALELEMRYLGEKVAKMVVVSDNSMTEDVPRDGFKGDEKGPSWDDIQKATNAVQPSTSGKQAMATHMEDRNLILERFRDLHESLASGPLENEFADNPALLKTQLMPHQLHVLTWLRWRETQRPAGGILADGMGLAKTMTMIALIAIDKEIDIDDDDDEYEDHTGQNTCKLLRGGTLVVCPASLMQQWADEVAQHCQPHRMSVYQHHGAASVQNPHRLAPFDLVITTYNTLLRETEKVTEQHRSTTVPKWRSSRTARLWVPRLTNFSIARYDDMKRTV
ncbi:unnamed protein product [Parnassius apollo]|uniref:(apollo) hypothetical protein n=1 Tax=Parnassius apollo TaxID=110799 RepID=A0A8S3WYB6_PARAO|nr:unnamed protein product [Parnassius apollo]